jgi:hypothetical protein
MQSQELLTEKDAKKRKEAKRMYMHFLCPPQRGPLMLLPLYAIRCSK